MARPGLTIHPKFRRLVHLLGDIPEAHALGHLEFLWSPAYENGNPEIGDELDVELAAKWVGERGKLCKALLECGGKGRAGFIEEIPNHPGRYQVHDLFDHAPEYVQSRSKREAERKKEKRCEYCGAGFRSTEDHARFCSHACRQASYRKKMDLVTEGDAHVTDPSVTVTEGDAPPAPAPAPLNKDSSELPPAASEPPFLVFPVVGNGSHEWLLTSSKVSEYTETYPGIDVPAECRKARQWCIDNSKKQKTAKGMPAFLNRWMQTAQNEAGRNGSVSQRSGADLYQDRDDAERMSRYAN